MVGHNVLNQSRASDAMPAAASQILVLEIRVLGSYHPPFIERIVRSGGLLKDIGRNANVGAISRRYPESQVGSFKVELVLGMSRSLVSAVLEVRVQHTGEVDRN
jgi:hypothetical protein